MILAVMNAIFCNCRWKPEKFRTSTGYFIYHFIISYISSFHHKEQSCVGFQLRSRSFSLVAKQLQLHHFTHGCAQGRPSFHISPANCLNSNQVCYVGCRPTLTTEVLIAWLVGNLFTEVFNRRFRRSSAGV